MKISEESFMYIVDLFAKHHEIIRESAKQLVESGRYDCFYTRLGWSALRYTTRQEGNQSFISQLYDIEGLNDSHITTAVRNAIKACELDKGFMNNLKGQGY